MSYLYETPWWLPAAMSVAGIVLFWTGNNRLEPRVRFAGVALVAAAVLLAAVSYVLESDREIVARRTREIVKAVARRDWPLVSGMLHPDVTVVDWRGRDTLVSGARRYAEAFDLKQAKVAWLTVEDEDPLIATTIRVFADTRETANIMTDWKLTWEKIDQDWLLIDVNPLGSPMLGGLDRYFQR